MTASRYKMAADGTVHACLADHGRGCRDVVVIDPEDREQVERLISTYVSEGIDRGYGMPRHQDGDRLEAMRAALREFANPTPPKPDEPQGLGAVVEDAEERLYVNVGTAKHKWRHGSIAYDWHEIAAVKVLSGGVQS